MSVVREHSEPRSSGKGKTFWLGNPVRLRKEVAFEMSLEQKVGF